MAIPIEWNALNPKITSTAASKSQPRKVYYANLPDPNNPGKTLRLEAITDNTGNIKSYTFYDSNKKQFFNKIGNGDPLAAPGSNLSVQAQKNLITLATTQTTALATSLGGNPIPPPLPGYKGPTPNTGFIKDAFKTISNDFGKNDEEIKKVLVYPYDAIYTKNTNINKDGGLCQDHLVISKYKYYPPYSDELFKKGTEIFTNGLTRGLDVIKESMLGMVMLPMPNNISDSNNVSWVDDNMNNLTAGVLATALSDPKTVIASGIAGSGLGALLSAAMGGNPIAAATSGAGAGAAASLYLPIIQALMSGNGNIKSIGSAAGVSKVLSAAGFAVSPESILARGAGVIPNSNLELLFNSPTIREFQFQYRMSPRSSTEAKEIKSIIKFFKRGMAPKKQNSTSGTGASYFLGTPNVFKLNYKTDGDNDIEGVNKIKTCALTGFSVNYAADGSWAAYDNGQPISYILNMAFKELEPVYDTDYDREDQTVGY